MSANVAVRFKEQAAIRPDQAALIFASGKAAEPWERWTFAELDRRSDQFASGFSERGIKRGDRVLFLVKPSLEFYALLLGLLKLGAVPTVVDPGMGMKSVLACISHIRPKAVVALSAVHAVRVFARKAFSSATIFITVGRRWFWGGATHLDCLGTAPFESPAFVEQDEAFIVFTSGSTGLPKGVSFRHGTFLGATRLMQERLGLGPGLTSLETFAPFVLFHLAAGESVVVPEMNLTKPATADPAKIVAAIHAHRPRAAFASPIVLRKVMEHCQKSGTKLPGLTHILTGVAPVPGDLHAGFRSILDPGGRILVNYGATEALTVTVIESEEVLTDTWPQTAKGAGNCVGRPFPEMDVRVIRITDDPIAEWSEDLRVAPGELGEIVVGGPVTSPEYKDLPDANAKAKIRDGDQILHRMGDLGYVDPQGRLWFCGRKAHRIMTAEGIIPNVPVEAIFNEHPAVQRSAVVPVGARGSQEALLLVELKPTNTWNDALANEILDLAKGTRWEGRVSRAMVHPGFPVDARHQAKIRNEVLIEWAAEHAGRALRSVA